MKKIVLSMFVFASFVACGGRIEIPTSPDPEPNPTPAPGDPSATQSAPQPGENPGAPSRPVGQTLTEKPYNALFDVGSFTAEYYEGTKLVATERVERPTINYPWSDLHGIRSEDFRGVWKGTLTIKEPSAAVDFNADYSWADGKLFIDEEEIAFQRVMTRTLSAGTHAVRVELDNNWHTTGFNMSFTRNPVYAAAEAQKRIAPTITNDTKIVHVDIYESSDRYNDVRVTLVGAARKPVFLVLSSYASVKWIIDAGGLDVRGIAYGAYGPGPTVVPSTGAPTYEVSSLRYAEGGAGSVTGRSADVVREEYALGSATIDVP